MGPPICLTVWYVSKDDTVIGMLQNGTRFKIENPPDNLYAGDIISVDSDSLEYMDFISRNGFGFGNTIGVIEEIRPNSILANINGIMRKVSNPYHEIEEGYTVEIGDAYTITSVVAPYSIADDPLEHDTSETIASLRLSSDSDKLTLDYDDFGGITRRHQHLINRTRLLLTERQSLVDVGVDIRMGALFYGPPGTGKTHFARILASQLDTTFYRVRGPEIISKWIGDTERLIRDIFQDASEREPSIIFFDEIDSIAADRSGEGRREFSQRLVAQLLSVIDGFDKREHSVFIIAATNKPGEIDEALLRPGRFSWQVEFPKPDESGRKDILKTLTREGEGRFKISDNVSESDMDDIVEITEGETGASLKALLNEAGVVCVENGRTKIEYLDMRKGQERIAEQKNRERL